jgi:aspartate 1-decarboxylase
VFAERKALAGKLVRVKGLVTKVSAVQGINYVHVKDGSGSAALADDDLIIMTTMQVKVDDVTTFEGKVVVDKDVGMGPRPVMLEEAKTVGN